MAQKISERRHPLYLEYIDKWNFYLESYKGGDNYRDMNLETHRLESPDDYSNRRNRSYFLNYCAPLCAIPADFIFQKEATRPRQPELTAFRDDVDRRGTNIHEFMRRVCVLSSVYGHIHILVDRPPVPDIAIEAIENDQTTKEDNVALRPYAVIIHPQSLIDWAVNNQTQELEWIIIEEQLYEDEDFRQDRGTIEQYRVWTRTEWFLFDADGEEISTGYHGLGFVPLITCYHKDIDLDLVGEGMLKDVAETNKTIFNWCSNIDEMVARQTFSQLICPDDGEMLTDEVDEFGRSKSLRRVGSSSIFTFPANASHAPRFISPDTAQIDVIWNMIDNHVREMFRMSGLISAKSSLIQLAQRTGKAQQFEFLDMAVFLAAKAKSLEWAENRMNSVFYKWLGNKESPARVHYPEKFDVVSSIELLELFTKVTLNQISARLNKEMAKRLVHQVLPHAEDAVVKEIYDEIEANEYLEDPNDMLGSSADEEGLESNTKDNPATQDIQDEKPKKTKEVVPNASKKDKRAKWRASAK